MYFFSLCLHLEDDTQSNNYVPSKPGVENWVFNLTIEME